LNLECGLVAVGRRYVRNDRQGSTLSRKTVLQSIQLGDLPGIGMVIIDGLVSTQRSRNTPPATLAPEIVKH
jgi:enamidase